MPYIARDYIELLIPTSTSQVLGLQAMHTAMFSVGNARLKPRVLCMLSKDSTS